MDTKKRATPYDAELERLEAIILHQSSETAILYYHYETGKREGYLAHGAEHFCGSDLCDCFQEGVDAVLNDPDYYGLSSPNGRSKRITCLCAKGQ